MNKIKEILQEQGKAVSDERILEKLNEYKINPDNVSNADAKEIASELSKEAQPIAGGLATATAQQSTPTKSEPTPRKPRKSAKQVALEKAITHAAKQTDNEITSFETVVRTQKNSFVDNRAESIVNEIRNTSTEILETVTEKLMKEEADTESFRQIGEVFSQTLFSLGANS